MNKKRLISLVLAALMLFSTMLTGCGSSSDEDTIQNMTDEAERFTITLGMYVITEKETTPEAAAAVEEAFNKITKAKFKTQVNLYFCTLDEYFDILEEKIAAIEAAIQAEEEEEKRRREELKRLKAEGKTLPATTAEETSDETTAEETVLNEWGLSELKYPEETDRQLDIITIVGYDHYKDYAEREILARLDDSLSSASKKLKDYISPVLMEAAKIDGSTFAIPNNHVMGEYTFLLINKELAEKWSYDPAGFNTLYSTMEFVEDIVKHEPDVTPICGDLEITNVKYFTLDHDTLNYVEAGPSVVAAYVGAKAGAGSRVNMRNIFATTQITEQMYAIRSFREKGYIKVDADPSQSFGIAVMKGGYDLIETYGEKYEMIVLESPMATEEELYAGMFGVTQYTRNLDRSMEIITYLNTNSELRNLLQYGIEGVNYTLDEETGALTRLNNTYMMKMINTGNAFIAYPEEGMVPNAWELAKKQNLDVRMDPLLGFTFADSDLNMDYVTHIEEVSKIYFEKLDACATAEEYRAFMETAYSELATDTVLKEATSVNGEGSPNYVYNEWYNIMYPPEE